MFTKQHFRTSYAYKTNKCLKNKTKVYKHVMFSKQIKCLQKKCLQNKSLQIRYVYKTKYKTESIQNKTKVYKHVMFTKESTTVYKHVMFTKQNKCLQKKCLQNKSLQTRYVYKTKYKTESLQNKTKQKFTNTLYL